MASPVEAAARKVRVFEALCSGKTPPEIARAEGVSEATIIRDVRALQKKLTEWAAERVRGALAVALAQFERAMTEAWDAYDEQRDIQRKWLAGDYDKVETDERGLVQRKPPILRLEIAALLGRAIEATKEYAKLAGLDKSALELTGDVLVRRYEGDVAGEV